MPPTPQSNVEKYLHVIAGHGGEIPSEPLSRVEYYLDEIVKGGGIGGKLRPEIVSALPAAGETGILYLVPSQGSGRNLCNEYFWIEDESRFEILGQTTVEVDLSGYVPNSRKVGGKALSNDIGITVSGTGAIEVTDNGTASSVAFDVSHKDSGVTAGSKGDTTNQTPGFGDTFKTLFETVDAKGHVTVLTERTVKIPDTKVTASADGLMAKEDKAKLDKYASKGSSIKGVYIDASGSPQLMTHELNADVPVNFAQATAAPLMDGTATVGTSAKYAREDHIHPTDTSRASATDVTAQGNRITALESENALLRELVNGIDAPIYLTKPKDKLEKVSSVTFHDGYAANVKELSVTLTPTQSGSGDPSPDNVRPISGVSSVTVTRTGENGANPQAVTVSLVDSNGNPLTVYGGTLNVTAGTLTVTHKYFHRAVADMNNEEYFPGWRSTGARACIPENHDNLLNGAVTSIGSRIRGNYGYDLLFFTVNDYGMRQSQWKERYPDLEMDIVLPLLNPRTYALTPAQLATLSGYNSVTTDAGTLSVTYRADTALSFENS